ncbi:MAG: tetratricopeptide repeat protein [Thermoguttaceae bacterium]|nr:tetratricopeptide repeat protein [Thermoguttaceae bacterium]
MKNGSAGRRSFAVPSSPARRLALAALLSVVGVAAAVISAYSVSRPRLRSAVPETAAHAGREVGALMLEADAAVGRLVDRYPYAPQAWAAAAVLHHRVGKRDQADELWRQCLELDSSQVVAHFALGQSAHERGDYAAAIAAFARAAELDTQSLVYPIHQAKVLADAGRTGEAARVLEDLGRKQPMSVTVMVMLGETYLQLKQYEKARENLESAVRLAPDLASPRYSLATALTRLGQVDKAQPHLQVFRRLKERDAEEHRQRLKRAASVADVQRDMADVHAEIGKAYLVQGDAAAGEQSLRRAIELNPSSTAAPLMLAWLYQQQGRGEDALHVLQSSWKAAPDDLTLMMTLAGLAEELGRYDEAESAYRRMIELCPTRASGYAALAGLYLRQGVRAPEAAELAAQAVTLEPVPSFYALLAATREQSGDTAGAIAAIEHAIRIDPGNGEYRQARAAIEARAARQIAR